MKQRRMWNHTIWVIVLGGLLISGTPAWPQEPADDLEPAAQEEPSEARATLQEGELSGDSLQLEPVTIAQEVKSPEAVRLTDPVPQTGVRREEFIIRNNRRMGDVIQRLPGVVVGGPVGENRDIELRGLDKSFTRVQVDGVQLPGPGDKREFSVHQLSSFMVESARVIRNPTAEFESDGVAGRVDIRTRQIPKELTFTGRAGYGGQTGIDGSFLNGSMAFGHRPTNWFGIMATADYLEQPIKRDRSRLFTPLTAGRGEVNVETTRQRLPSLNVDLGFFYRAGEFHLKPMVLNVEEDKPGIRTFTNFSQLPTQDEERVEQTGTSRSQTKGLGFSHKHAFANGVVWDSLGGYYAGSLTNATDAQTFRESAGTFNFFRRELQNESRQDSTYNVLSNLTVPLNLAVRQTLKVGAAMRLRERNVSLFKSQISNTGAFTITSVPGDRYQFKENYFAGYIQDEVWLTDRLSIVPGIRFEQVYQDAAGGDGTKVHRSISDFNPSLPVLYRLRDDLTLRAAVSRTLNRPDFNQMTPIELIRGQRIIRGNAQINPARSWNVDVGGEYVTSNFFLGVNLFHKWITQIVEEVDTGIDIGGRDVLEAQNVGNGWARGVELEERVSLAFTGLPFLKTTNVWANQTFLESRLQSASGEKRRFNKQPEYILNAGLDYRYAPLGTIFTLAWRYFPFVKEIQSNSAFKITNPVSIIDVAVRQAIYKNFSFFLEAGNLTNETKVEREINTVGNFSNLNLQQSGRTFLLGAEWYF
ncbi:MAG: TonB-dependent receptor [Nitrospira sp.]|nr:TonB-dependent receptor [Nitrospira sp.]